MRARFLYTTLAAVLAVAAGLVAVWPRHVEPPRNTCPVCLQTVTFLPAGDPPRPFAGCPSCGSLERHRLLSLYMRQKTPLFRDQLSVLHFSPERGLRAMLSNQKNLTYATSWYEPDRPADYQSGPVAPVTSVARRA